MALTWVTQDGGYADIAEGGSWRYLILTTPGQVVLTRYRFTYGGPGRHGIDRTQAVTAAQAARYALPVHPNAGSGAVGSDRAVARQIAQDFEDGEDIFGHPAWQQDPPPGEKDPGPEQDAPPPHPELGPGTGHQADGPADCARCQLVRDNAHWLAGG